MGNTDRQRQPRVIVAGARQGAREQPDRLLGALASAAVLCRVPAPAPFLDAMTCYRVSSRLLRGGRFEAVHLLDARLAPVGLLLRRRLGVPVTVDVVAGDIRRRSPLGRLALRSAVRLDEAFVHEPQVARELVLQASGVRVVEVPPVAAPLMPPSGQVEAAIAKALRDPPAGRRLIGVVARTPGAIRRMRASLLPMIERPSVFIVFGLGARPARGARRAPRGHELRLAGRRFDAGTLAEAARQLDALIIPDADAVTVDDELLLAVAGVPVVVAGAGSRSLLVHEANALVTASRDAAALAGSLNQLLSLPAAQRRSLGGEFASYTLLRWPAEPAAELYADRFAALVGRPRIPSELLLAA